MQDGPEEIVVSPRSRRRVKARRVRQVPLEADVEVEGELALQISSDDEPGEYRMNLAPENRAAQRYEYEDALAYDELIGALADANGQSGKNIAYSFFTRYGTYPLKTILRDLQTFIFHKEQGTVHTVRAAIHFPITIGSAVLGGFVPTLWPGLTQGFKDIIQSGFGFLGEGFANVVSIGATVLVTTGVGAKVSDMILNLAFNKLFSTPHSRLYFTMKEKRAILESSGIDAMAPDNMQELETLISYLQTEYDRTRLKLEAFTERGDEHRVLKKSDHLRTGNWVALQTYTDEVAAKNSTSLAARPQSIPNQIEGGLAHAASGIIDSLLGRRRPNV